MQRLRSPTQLTDESVSTASCVYSRSTAISVPPLTLEEHAVASCPEKTGAATAGREVEESELQVDLG